MKQTAVLKFYKELERYGLIKDSQFILNIPLELMSELFEQAQKMEEIDIKNAFYDGRTWNMSWNEGTYFIEVYKKNGRYL